MEATERSRDYSVVTRGRYKPITNKGCFSCRAFKLQKCEISMADYFSGDEVAFFVSKLLFRDGFARDGFGFLPLKDVAQRLAA